jgi:hypothetical protein
MYDVDPGPTIHSSTVARTHLYRSSVAPIVDSVRDYSPSPKLQYNIVAPGSTPVPGSTKKPKLIMPWRRHSRLAWQVSLDYYGGLFTFCGRIHFQPPISAILISHFMDQLSPESVNPGLQISWFLYPHAFL